MPDIRLTSLVPRSTGIARRINAAIDAFFVPDCPICHKGDAQTDGLCADCWRDLTLLDGRGCFHCSRPISGSGTADPDWICAECHHAPPAWQRGRAVFAYNGAGRRLVLSLKHGDRQDTTPLFARWAIAAASDLIADADLAVPIPLHWMRRLKRRSNQAAEIARAICRQTTAPIHFTPRALIRNRFTGSQEGKDRADRFSNVGGAFQPGHPDMRGKRILLIDDVMTTGATMNAAATACLESGARSVNVLVMAVVIRDGEAYIAAPERET